MGREMERICLLVISSLKSFFGKLLSNLQKFWRNYRYYCATEKIIVLSPAVNIISEQIDSLETSRLSLLVQSGDGFIGFAAFDAKQKKVFAWVVYEMEQTNSAIICQEKLKSITEAHPWISKNYERAVLANHTSKNILVPSSFHQEQHKEYLFELMYGKQQDDLYVKDMVIQQSLVNHYAVNGALAVVLNQHFTKGQWWHVQSLLLTQNASQEAKVTATIWFNELHLSIEKDGNWLLLQTYLYHTPEDVLYYILNAMQQLGLSPDETPVLLQGMVDQKSALYDVLYGYIVNLQLNNNLQFEFPASEFPVYLTASLDQLLICVL